MGSAQETDIAKRSKQIGQPMRQANIDAIVAYIESGIKAAGDAGRLGIEVEHFVVDAQNDPVMYSDEHGVDWLLEQLAGTFPERFCGTDGKLIGVGDNGKTVTLEPGAQVELSSGPYTNVCAIQADFETFGKRIDEILAPYGEHMVACGYRPKGKARDIELIPKKRYHFMNLYFEKIGEYGRRMMRCSASTQISIDFFSAEDCTRKLRISSILAPLFTLLCDNTPVFEDEPRTHPLMRADVWRYCDPDRCESVPDVANPAFSLEDYARFVLDTPAILVPDNDDSRATDQTFGDVYASREMTRDEIEHALSMIFTDVRVKTYLEIRPADSMPAPYVASYAALAKGLFYCEQNLAELDQLFANVRNKDIAETRDSLAAHGYNGTAYGEPASQQMLKLFDWAQRGLSENEKRFLQPLHSLAIEKRTLADLAEQPAR